ncbi:WD40-repeat-containing domain protein, partial [Rhizoctonia solani]
LAHRCFKVMERQLRFNIRNLQTSYVFDHAVADLKDRIESNIPASLEYTCQHWANHLCLAPGSLELCHTIYEFLTTKLLFWMELLNLKQHQMTGLYALPNAQRWVAGTDASYDLRILIHDAIIFVTRFFVSPVSLSTPHIYISALPVSAGRVRDIYSKNQGLVELWDLGACKMIASSYVGRAKSILTVQFSPDREYIVSGTREGSVWMSKYFEGQLINACGPFETHKENVWSVNFSADGMYIASASSDGNVCIWDIVKRCLVVELCQGHSGSVRSVKFSPDGMKVAWGSDDCSVCIWNPVTGELILGPLERHSDVVWSIGFSQDGANLISGSDDKSIRIWDATLGISLGDALEGHTGSILSAVFSPDGKYIASGSGDHTVRIWNTTNRSFVAFHKHTDCVWVVDFSPNGSATQRMSVMVRCKVARHSDHNTHVDSVVLPATVSIALISHAHALGTSS